MALEAAVRVFAITKEAVMIVNTSAVTTDQYHATFRIVLRRGNAAGRNTTPRSAKNIENCRRRRLARFGLCGASVSASFAAKVEGKPPEYKRRESDASVPHKLVSEHLEPLPGVHAGALQKAASQVRRARAQKLPFVR